MGVAHDDLARKLAVHLAQNTDRMIWTDMQLGPQGSPRPDVYTINKSYVRPLPLAYECKISKADFMSDVTSGKWQKYLEFASGVIFCAPKGLISKDDVPSTCGLIIYNAESDAFFKAKGPTLIPVSLPQEAMLKLLIDGVRRIHTERRTIDISEYALTLRIREKVGADVCQYVRDKDLALSDLARIHDSISRAREELRRVLDERDVEVAKAREEGEKRAQVKIDEADRLWGELRETLKLRKTSGYWDAHQAIGALRNELTKHAEVKRLAAVINGIADDINRASNHPAATVKSVEGKLVCEQA